MFNGVEFVDGATDEFSGMFIALGTAGSDAFARKLGLYAENGIITVDKNMQTDIPGFYAAGDCTGAPFQVAKAVYQGMTAAYHIINKE
ncbi:hypothetical protein SDC9_191152 [bioreactor metagenome]|uniref:FAD/NAD(P)-binding domain-containing protein n=1 Tax=bioreactor metagenome TaxID=1076179 RepID=A0A645HYM9_9ZZZZ